MNTLQNKYKSSNDNRSHRSPYYFDKLKNRIPTKTTLYESVSFRAHGDSLFPHVPHDKSLMLPYNRFFFGGGADAITRSLLQKGTYSILYYIII